MARCNLIVHACTYKNRQVRVARRKTKSAGGWHGQMQRNWASQCSMDAARCIYPCERNRGKARASVARYVSFHPRSLQRDACPCHPIQLLMTKHYGLTHCRFSATRCRSFSSERQLAISCPVAPPRRAVVTP